VTATGTAAPATTVNGVSTGWACGTDPSAGRARRVR